MVQVGVLLVDQFPTMPFLRHWPQKNLLLAENRPEAEYTHYRQLLSVLLWKITEAESMNKRGTRLQSQGARCCTKVANLEHDHVYQRSKMIDALEKAAPHEIDDILKRAIGCTVTKGEHNLLAKYNDEDGWERYRKAGIVVFDMQTGGQVDFDTFR